MLRIKHKLYCTTSVSLPSVPASDPSRSTSTHSQIRPSAAVTSVAECRHLRYQSSGPHMSCNAMQRQQAGGVGGGGDGGAVGGGRGGRAFMVAKV